MAEATPTVLITGASGLLGRSLVKVFAESGKFKVVGTAFSRAGDGLVKMDLTKKEQIDKVVMDIKPTIIVHAAAEKRPDVVEKEEEATDRINVKAVWELAQVAKEVGSWLIYISTDYVFDGSSPPYKITDSPNPLNKYGKSKLRGEHAVMAAHPSAAVLRVPVLFGKTEKLSESAVMSLIDAVKAKEEKSVDHWAKRFPTFTDDVAEVLQQLCSLYVGQGGAKGEFGQGLSGIFHWSSERCLSKYEMCELIGKILGESTEHLKPNPNPPPGAPRPKDAHLDRSRLEGLGIHAETEFEKALGLSVKQQERVYSVAA